MAASAANPRGRWGPRPDPKGHVVKETDDARSLVFTVPEGVEIPADRLRYAPGQFLTLRVPSDRTGSVARCYSLCSSPHTGDPMTVTVKRTDGGYASHWLCDNAHAGMRIHVLAPWSEQAQVFSVEGHRWPLEPGEHSFQARVPFTDVRSPSVKVRVD